jgi:hypothetical protein
MLLRWGFSLFFTTTVVVSELGLPVFIQKSYPVNSPALEHVSEADDGSIPPTTTINHKQATMGEEEFTSPPAMEKPQVTHVLLKVCRWSSFVKLINSASAVKRETTENPRRI